MNLNSKLWNKKIFLYLIFSTIIFVTAAWTGYTSKKFEFFIVWGTKGRWDCTLTINDGRFIQVEPYMFLNNEDRIDRINSNKIICSTFTDGNADGLHILALVNTDFTVKFSSNQTNQEINFKELSGENFKVIHIHGDKNFLIVGKGNPGFGPQHFIKRTWHEVFKSPVPKKSIALPSDYREKERHVKIILSESPKGHLNVRRCSKNNGLLYLEIFANNELLKGKAKIELDGKIVGEEEINNSLWLSLKPYIGTISVKVVTPLSSQNFIVPTTLVEVRKNMLFLNGEPFLIKGTLPGNKLTSKDAHYIKSLGMNTLRGGNVLKYARRYGFMANVSIQGKGLKKLSYYTSPSEDNEFKEDLSMYLKNERSNGLTAVKSPYTLVIQLDNERTIIGGNPMDKKIGSEGADPWSDYMKGSRSIFKRLTYILVKDWNIIKPMAPALPLGYANESLGYIAPSFLNIYMHNTYLEKDRYGVPLKKYMIWQGCNKRPFINTEFGANRYTPQSYHGGGNSPVLEKLQAWNYGKLWHIFMREGTAGGTCYRLFDGNKNQTIQGTSNFGIMTYNHKPKLACWVIWHMWRDFEIAPMRGNKKALLITYRRNYWARNCRLMINYNGKKNELTLDDFSPKSQRIVELPFNLKSFHWQINYTTHKGLKMLAVGAFPKSIEEHDFINELKGRKTFDFLKELFNSKVITVKGQPAPPTFAQLQGSNGVIPVAFKKPDGVIYVTAFARISPDKSYYIKSNINTSFTGMLTEVDEWTGKPIPANLKWAESRTGIKIENVKIPIIPGPIGQRSDKPITMPVFRITPFNFNSRGN